jgi:hypothetical protein
MADDVKTPPATKPAIDKANVMKGVAWFGARLREPSTYAGLAVLLAAIVNVKDAAAWSTAVQSIGIGIGGIIAILLPEPKAAGTKVGSGTASAILLAAALGASLCIPDPADAAAATKAGAQSGSSALTMTQVQQNPLALLAQFTIGDLQAALADANAQTPPDTAAAACYAALLTVVQSKVADPLPSGPGIFQALQKARDAKALIANLQSPTGPLSALNNSCAPLVMDAQNTLLALGVSVGLVANPVSAPLAAAGVPGAIAAFLAALPK